MNCMICTVEYPITNNMLCQILLPRSSEEKISTSAAMKVTIAIECDQLQAEKIRGRLKR